MEFGALLYGRASEFSAKTDEPSGHLLTFIYSTKDSCKLGSLVVGEMGNADPCGPPLPVQPWRSGVAWYPGLQEHW